MGLRCGKDGILAAGIIRSNQYDIQPRSCTALRALCDQVCIGLGHKGQKAPEMSVVPFLPACVSVRKARDTASGAPATSAPTDLGMRSFQIYVGS